MPPDSSCPRAGGESQRITDFAPEMGSVALELNEFPTWVKGGGVGAAGAKEAFSWLGGRG